MQLAPQGGMRQAGWFFDRWAVLDRPLRHLPRGAATLLLIIFAAAMAFAAISAAPASELRPPAAGETASISEGTPRDSGDLALYERIGDRVKQGEDYYTVAAEEHRARNYPVRPFVTIRPPTLAKVRAMLGPEGLRILAIALLGVTILVWERKLAKLGEPLVTRAGFAILLYLGAVGVFTEGNLLLHELPAGLLLTLAFGLYSRRWWWLALLCALAAVALREIAVHFLVAWIAVALVQRRWREVAALAAALVAVGIGLAFHKAGVEATLLPGDPASPGWVEALGPRFVLESLVRFSWLVLIPPIAAVPLALLALLGWMGLPMRTGMFAGLWFTGFFAATGLLAREDNFYWVLLTMPAYLAGLLLVPRAIADLMASARGATGPTTSKQS